MFTVFTEREAGGKPPEHDSSPSADGDPGRSPAEHGAFHAALVSDDTEAYEDPQTGVSLTCNPSDAEIRKSIRKTGFFRAADWAEFLVAGVIAAVASEFLKSLIKHGGTSWQWIVLAVQFIIVVAFFSMPFWNLNQEKKKYRENGMGKITIYPDRIDLAESGRELPLDGTGEMLRTETAYTLIYPPEKKSHDRALRFVIIPRRCVSEDLLPYVEAMLAAGTRPRIE